MSKLYTTGGIILIVIEGAGEKSKKLENLIRKELRTNSVLIIDSIGIRGISTPDDFDQLIVNQKDTNEQVIESFETGYSEMYKMYDWIVFYVNSDVASIDTFKELDRKFPQNFIVTIQNDNQGLTSVYYV